jgi:sarcosine oxidase delta subunit
MNKVRVCQYCEAQHNTGFKVKGDCTVTEHRQVERRATIQYGKFEMSPKKSGIRF